MALASVTITGIDERTDLQQLLELQDRYPNIEWGVLYSFNRQGQHPRYPSQEWINKLLVHMKNKRLRCALHICGSAVGDFLEGNGYIVMLADNFPRVQLNFNIGRFDISTIRIGIQRAKNRQVITQHNEKNTELWKDLTMCNNHAVLFDQSGGYGIAPREWPKHLKVISCGYAGGLGPDNLAEQLPMIDNASEGNRYWVDMETKVRDNDDYLDLNKVRQCLRLVDEFVGK